MLVDIPTKDEVVCGFSSNGINFFCDKESHKEIMKWHHDSTCRLPWFDREYVKLLQELNTLKETLRKLGA